MSNLIFLLLIIPYLVIKKYQAEIMIRFFQIKTDRRSIQSTLEEEIELDYLYNELRKLNKVGI